MSVERMTSKFKVADSISFSSLCSLRSFAANNFRRGDGPYHRRLTLEAIDGDGSVNLRGGELAVAEQFLHAAQVGAVIEQVRGEGVAQLVRRQLRVGVRR